MEGHTFGFPPAAATARSGRNRTGCRWLPVIVRHNLVHHLHNTQDNTFSPPSEKRKEKNSHPNPGGVFALAFTLASFFAHAPVSALGVLLGGPFFVSTHVDDPTTGVGTLGGGG